MAEEKKQIEYRVVRATSIDMDVALGMLSRRVDDVMQNEDYVEPAGGICVLAEENGSWHVFQALIVHTVALPGDLAELIFQTQEIAK